MLEGVDVVLAAASLCIVLVLVWGYLVVLLVAILDTVAKDGLVGISVPPFSDCLQGNTFNLSQICGKRLEEDTKP